jgi:tRNA (guanine-N7-)-methyltransferase
MRSKVKRFSDNQERDNVIEPDKEIAKAIKGNWRQLYFKNDHPIVVELACGRGEYTIGMAKLFPEKNFIGVDIKGDRIWKGSSIAIEENLTNAAFLRTKILMIENFLEPDEVDEIWITFPDPRPRKRDIRRRLTSPRFLEIYKSLMKPGRKLYLKTDNIQLFEYTLEVLQSRDDVINLECTYDLYNSPMAPEAFGIKTKYEKKFNAEGEDIKFLRFQFTAPSIEKLK